MGVFGPQPKDTCAHHCRVRVADSPRDGVECFVLQPTGLFRGPVEPLFMGSHAIHHHEGPHCVPLMGHGHMVKRRPPNGAHPPLVDPQ